MPLPFWLLGLTQVVGGRSLLLARGVCLAIGLLCVVLTAIVGRQVGGPGTGALAALFLSTQGVLIGYLTTATYHSLAAALLLGGLALILSSRQPVSAVAGTAVSSLLFLTRTNLWPLLPAMGVIAFTRVRQWPAKIAICVAIAAVPLTFFSSDPRLAKVLAYGPLVGSIVERLGFHSTLATTAFEPTAAGRRMHAIARVLRMYEFWVLAALMPIVLLIVSAHGRRAIAEATTQTRTIVLLLIYLAATQAILFWDRLAQYAAYLPSWAPLCAVVLAVLWIEALRHTAVTGKTRVLLASMLPLLLACPMLIVRHPLKPAANTNTIQQLEIAKREFDNLIPAGAHVFLLGNSMPLYLAGIDPYVRQIYSTETLAAIEDRPIIERHGLWGLREIDLWLGSDADYAVTQPDLMAKYRASRPIPIARIEAYLSREFRYVARVNAYPPFVYDVYRRTRHQYPDKMNWRIGAPTEAATLIDLTGAALPHPNHRTYCNAGTRSTI